MTPPGCSWAQLAVARSFTVHIFWEPGETSRLICTASWFTAHFTLSSRLLARLVLHCTKHSSVIFRGPLAWFLSQLLFCGGTEQKSRLADLPEVACTSLLKENRQMGEQKSSSVLNKVMVTQHFKMSHFQSFSPALILSVLYGQ